MRLSVRRGLQNALFRRVRFSSPGQTSSRLTQKRILYVGPHEKAHSVLTASRKSAVCMLGLTQKRSLYVGPHAKGLQNALFRRVRFSSPGQTSSRLTQKRILCSPPHAKAQSACWASRKSAVCTLGLTQKRILYVGPHGKAQSACWASRKSAVCPRHSRRMRLSVRSCHQNALFRTARVAECAFP